MPFLENRDLIEIITEKVQWMINLPHAFLQIRSHRNKFHQRGRVKSVHGHVRMFILANWLMLTMIVLGLVYLNGLLCYPLFTKNWLLTQWVQVIYKIFSLATNQYFHGRQEQYVAIVMVLVWVFWGPGKGVGQLKKGSIMSWMKIKIQPSLTCSF